MKRLSQSGSSNFCPELRKNALLISQSHFSNFALHVIRDKISAIRLRLAEWASLIKRTVREFLQWLSGVSKIELWSENPRF